MGMVTITSSLPAMQRFLMFGGMYFLEGGTYQYDPKSPLIHAKVRQALIKAVDLKAIQDEIYLGRVEQTYRSGFVPYQEGWNPDWKIRYEEMYGYDPERARELLKEAGYGPGDVKIEIDLHSPPGQPEASMVQEAMEPYWREIGVDVKIQPVDFGAFVQKQIAGDVHGKVWISRNRPIRTTQGYLEAWHTDAVVLKAYLDNYLEDAIAELRNIFDLEKRDQLAREIGNHLYDQFAQFNLGATFQEITVNPKVIADWVLPGTTPIGYTHYYMIKRVK